MHLKRQGQFMCRTLSYHGCHFRVDEQSLDATSLQTYDAAAALWIDLYMQLNTYLKQYGLDYYRKNNKNKRKKSRFVASDHSSASEDSETEDSESESDSDLDSTSSSDSDEEEEAPLKLPVNDNAAITMIMRYFWGKGYCIDTIIILVYYFIYCITSVYIVYQDIYD